jgi:hypothetical protein
MSVYATYLVTSHLMCEGLLQPPMYVWAYKGTAPANLNNMTRSGIQLNRQSDLLVSYGVLTMAVTGSYSLNNAAWEMTVSPAPVNCVATGTISWFIASHRTTTPTNNYDYFACDSVSLPGGSGVLQLASLSCAAGAVAPIITDFTIKA